jgi:hypothetical protein
MDALDAKAGVMLGFVMLLIGLVFESMAPMPRGPWPVYPYVSIAGTVALFVAAFLGVMAFFIRSFRGGPKLSQLVDMYREDPKWDFEMVVSRKYFDAVESNKVLLSNKAMFAKGMFAMTLAGLAMILISRVLYMSGA